MKLAFSGFPGIKRCNLWMAGVLLLTITANIPGRTADFTTPASSFVYIMTNPTGPNVILAFKRDPRSGSLSTLGSYPTGGMGQKLVVAMSQSAIVTDGSFLYAVNSGSNDISAFVVQRDGALRLLGTVSSGGSSPITLALHGDLLYVGNQGTTQEPANYTGFRVNSEGMPAPLLGSTVTLNIGDGPTALLFNSTGSKLLGFRLNGHLIDAFAVNANGTLLRTDMVGSAAPFGAIFNPANGSELVVTLVGIPGAATYSVSTDGLLGINTSAADARSKDPCWLAITSNGTFTWSSNFQPSSLSLFAIDKIGNLTFVGEHDTSSIGSNSSDIALDATGKFLYQLLPFPPSHTLLHVMAVTGKLENGGLEDLDTISIPGDHIYPMGLVIVDKP